MTAIVDLDALIDRQSLRHVTMWVLLWAMATMLADGYDLLAISYVAPRIIAQWGLTRASFGPVFSLSNAASMLGGLIGGVVADRFGRKRTLVGAALLLGVSTLGTASAGSLGALIAWRCIAGLGLGAVPPLAIVIVNEFAPKRARATIVAALYFGNALGSVCAGVVAATLIASHGWPIVFLIGGIAPLAAGIGLTFFLPESLRFLVARRPDSTQIRPLAQRLAGGVTFAADTRFVMREPQPTQRLPLAQLLAPERRAATLLFWLAYFACGWTLYSMVSWSPTILESLGIPPAHAALIASSSSVAGWIGGMLITRLMDRFGLRAMIVPPLLGLPLLGGLGYLGGAPEPLIVSVSVLAGMAFSGGQTGLHATGGLIYPTVIRGNGVAVGLLVTRLAGVVAPWAAGLLFTSNAAVRPILWLAGAPLAIVSACYIGLDRLQRERAAQEAVSLRSPS
jgi:AAHS family 4-hydroxybenzoate transporter-like MFS transporter